jgi:hypothetical protein
VSSLSEVPQCGSLSWVLPSTGATFGVAGSTGPRSCLPCSMGLELLDVSCRVPAHASSLSCALRDKGCMALSRVSTGCWESQAEATVLGGDRHTPRQRNSARGPATSSVGWSWARLLPRIRLASSWAERGPDFPGRVALVPQVSRCEGQKSVYSNHVQSVSTLVPFTAVIGGNKMIVLFQRRETEAEDCK